MVTIDPRDGTRRIVFFLDVDNTLLDNDALKAYLTDALTTTLGAEGSDRFWQLYEDVRREHEVVDLPLTAQRYAAVTGDPDARQRLTALYEAIPFARFLYPQTLATLRHLHTIGGLAILSDGDQEFQRMKIERSGLGAAVDGHVLIFVHKQDHLAEVAAAQPAQHMVLVDDKGSILHDVKVQLRDHVSTVHVLQGHYAREPLAAGFQPEITVPSIGDLQALTMDDFLRTEPAPVAPPTTAATQAVGGRQEGDGPV